MVAVPNDYSRLQGNLKRVYGGNKITQIVPDNAKMYFEDWPFVPAQDRLGDQYVEAVNLAVEQGFTTASSQAGVVALTPPSAGIVKQALIDSGQIIGQAQLDFATAAKAMKANSPQAFEKSMDRVISNLTLGHRRRQVINFIWGGANIGVISGVSGATVTLTNASFAPGIYFGSDNMPLDIWKADFTVYRGQATIVGYNLTLGTVTLSALPAGTVATDVIYIAGALNTSTGVVQESLGVAATLDQAASLYGINLVTYPAFAGNTYAAGGVALSQAVIDAVGVVPFNKGFEGKLKLYTSGTQWQNLNQEMIARVKPNTYKTTETPGYRSLTYWTNAGEVETIASPWIKNGEALLCADGTWKRVGATDIKLGDPLDEDTVIRRVEGYNAYSVISYSLQAMFTAEPMYSVHVTGLV